MEMGSTDGLPKTTRDYVRAARSTFSNAPDFCCSAISALVRWPYHLVECGNADAKAHRCPLALAVVFERGELGEPGYFVGLGLTGFLGVGAGAGFFECATAAAHFPPGSDFRPRSNFPGSLRLLDHRERLGLQPARDENLGAWVRGER